MSETTSSFHTSILQHLSGPIRYRITNAYMFVAVLQKNRETLCHLLAALLHIQRDEITSVEILNPIILGEAVDEKDCILDLLVLFNNHTRINLELQMENERNWNNRSLYYLARKLCDLSPGEDYNALKPMIHIGILDFNYPEGNEEFYQQNLLMNRKTHRIYSDKIQLNVLCLNRIENAAPEDRESGLYDWAKVFQAAAWEELKALADNNKVIQDTIVTIAQLSEDEKIRQQCERREKYERDRISAVNFGKEQGISHGIAQIRRLIQLLDSAGRQDDIVRIADDELYCDQLLKEFGLSQS